MFASRGLAASFVSHTALYAAALLASLFLFSLSVSAHSNQNANISGSASSSSNVSISANAQNFSSTLQVGPGNQSSGTSSWAGTSVSSFSFSKAFNIFKIFQF